MSTHYISKPDETIGKIVRATFPGYKGKKFKLSTDVPGRLDSYWDGGSRDYYAFYELSTGKQFSVSSNHPFFESHNPRKLDSLPNGIVLVKHSIFCGKDVGITIYVNPEQLTPLLPPKQEVSEHERIVLKYTSGLKSSYNGISNYRFYAAHRGEGISLNDWDTAKQSLIQKKLLNKAGAITAAGRNALFEL
jgi:hypothetical protein